MLAKTKRNQGFSILELSLSISAIAIISASIISLVSDNKELARDAESARKMKFIIEASKNYLELYKKELENIITETPIGIDLIGQGQANLPSLQERGFLPQNFDNTNTYQQSHKLLVRKGSEGHLESIIITTGGNNIPLKNLVKTAAMIGYEGGFISDDKPYKIDQIQGAFDNWQLERLNWLGEGYVISKGRLVALVHATPNKFITDYLYRNEVPGSPEVNQMEADLNLANNDIINAKDLDPENLFISKDLNVSGDAIISNITEAKNIFVSGNLNSDKNIYADQFTSPAFYDSENSSFFFDPNGTSKLNILDIEDNITANSLAIRQNLNSNALSTGNLNLSGNLNIANHLYMNGQCLRLRHFINCYNPSKQGGGYGWTSGKRHGGNPISRGNHYHYISSNQTTYQSSLHQYGTSCPSGYRKEWGGWQLEEC